MQMEREIRELTKQRDLAQSRVEDLLRMVGCDQDSRQEVHISANLLQNLFFCCITNYFFYFLFRLVVIIILIIKRVILGKKNIQNQRHQVLLICTV